ncbi:MAG: stage III sporulation protein AF [Lachnospiraceae bacterium]
MDIIVNWAKNIAFFVLFMNLSYQLLPEGNLQKYGKLFCGFLMILLLVEPVMGILQLSDQLTSLVEQAEMEMEEAMLNQMDIEEMQMESCEKQIVKEVEYILEENQISYRQIEVEMAERDGQFVIKTIKIYLKQQGNEDDLRSLQENLAQYLGVGTDVIAIS